MRRFTRIALVCAIFSYLWGFLWIQTGNIGVAASVEHASIERKQTQIDNDPPSYGVAERFSVSFPKAPAESGHILNRTVHHDFSHWPEMKYLNESVMLDGSEITISDYKIVAGESIPIAYLPETGEAYDAPDGGPRWDRWNSPALVIPPSASLVMVRIDVNPPMQRDGGCINPFTGNETKLREDYLLIAYPRTGEKTALRTLIPGEVDYGPFDQPQSGCFGNGWYYFFLPIMDPDNSKTWVIYSDDSDPILQVFWTLSESP